MIGQYLIAFREGFEAAMICSIMLAYLHRTKRSHLSRYMYYGAAISIASSIFLGGTILAIYGSISKPLQVLFEGTAALIAVFVLTWMIYWLALRGRTIKQVIEREIEKISNAKANYGIMTFTIIVVFREALETVLFLTPFLISDLGATLAGMLLGLISAFAFSYIIFIFGMKINIKNFFYYTSILLILLAAGLLGYGAHELLEYSELNGVKLAWLSEIAYDLHIPTDSIWHHKGIIGSILAVIFGYAVKAEWLRVILHIGYLLIILPIIIRIYRRS
ncbi:MAG: FTR1 family protein [Methanocellales archaeon]